jgi:DNA polymerase III delta subunit
MKAQFDVKKALAHTCVMIASNEGYLRDAALNALREALGPDAEEIVAIHGDERPPQGWFAEAGTAPFLSERRVVLIRNLLRAGRPKDWGDIAAMLKKLAPTGLLVLVADDEQGDDDKQKTLDRNRKEWTEAAAKAGAYVFNPAIDTSAVSTIVQEVFKQAGKQVTGKTCQLLAEMVGNNMTRATEEAEKVVLYVGRADRITENDLKEVVVASPEWSIWKLVEAVFTGSPGTTIRELQGFLSSHKSPQDVAFRSVLPRLSAQLRTVWQARVCLDAGAYSARSAPPEVQRSWPSKGLGSLSSWAEKKAFESARHVDLDGLARCFTLLSDADASIKGVLPSVETVETVERMCLAMNRELAARRRRNSSL